MTLITPDPPPADCDPPLVATTHLVPDAWLRAKDRGKGIGTTTYDPPPVGTTWDCPECGRVWVVQLHYPRLRTGYAPARRVWVKAGPLDTRRHRKALSRQKR